VDRELTAPSLAFINATEARTRAESPVIFSWKKNANVQVKLMRVAFLSRPPGDGAPANVELRPLAARVLPGSPVRVQFHWRLEGPAQARYFDVTVRDVSGGKVDWVRRNLLGTSVIWDDAASGRKVWQVRATLEDGRVVVSPSAGVEIPGGGVFPFVVLLGAVGGACGLAYYLAGRRKRLRPQPGQTG
jgi:hypothetical protein